MEDFIELHNGSALEKNAYFKWNYSNFLLFPREFGSFNVLGRAVQDNNNLMAQEELEFSGKWTILTTCALQERTAVNLRKWRRRINLSFSVFSPSNVKVDVPNKFGFTALMVAAQRGYTRYGPSLLTP